MNNIQNQPSFGMALYMPPKQKIARKIGNFAAEESEKARATLKDLAKDVDIYIRTHKDRDGDVRLNGFDCMVTNVGKNPLSRYINRKTKNSSVRVSNFEEPLSTNLTEQCQRLKEKFLRYSK